MKSSAPTIPELIAQRGYAAAFPENTMPAMAAAVELSARYLECDIQLSGDGVPVLFHDRTLARQCAESGEIRDYPLARLQEFSAGCPARFGKRFTGVKIAALTELVRHSRVVPSIELKENSLAHFGPDPVLDQVIRKLKPSLPAGKRIAATADLPLKLVGG